MNREREMEEDPIGERSAGPQQRDVDRMPDDSVPGAQSPIEHDPAILAPGPKIAAGLPAVYQTLRFSLREMGPMRTLKTLLSINKKKGFDCQSCAWPSPRLHEKFDRTR
jgi:hypothetical protein